MNKTTKKPKVSVFQYSDFAVSSTETYIMNAKIENLNVGIVGLGGSGSYVLDFISKTPVWKVHLFDGDTFDRHNAFRAPSAASFKQTEKCMPKVMYYKKMYSKIHRYIIPHNIYLDSTNVSKLKRLDFVFLCLDKDDCKGMIIDYLTERGIPFIDVGMSVTKVENKLRGVVRVTSAKKDKTDHIKTRISRNDDATVDDAKNEYSRNIQIVELNALNAAFAIIKWKKMYCYYLDVEPSYHSIYTVHCNEIRNEELSET